MKLQLKIYYVPRPMKYEIEGSKFTFDYSKDNTTWTTIPGLSDIGLNKLETSKDKAEKKIFEGFAIFVHIDGKHFDMDKGKYKYRITIKDSNGRTTVCSKNKFIVKDSIDEKIYKKKFEDCDQKVPEPGGYNELVFTIK